MKLKGRIIAFAVLLVLVVSVVSVLRHAPAGRQITVEAYASIRAGMSLKEVESILGSPPGDFCEGPVQSVGNGKIEILMEDAATMYGEQSAFLWKADNAIVSVQF